MREINNKKSKALVTPAARKTLFSPDDNTKGLKMIAPAMTVRVDEANRIHKTNGSEIFIMGSEQYQVFEGGVKIKRSGDVGMGQ